MNKVNVNRQALLDIVRANQAKALETYRAAEAQYRREMAAWYRTQAAALEDGRPLDEIGQDAPVSPFDPSTHYARVRAMLELSVDETVTLTEEEFTQYVLDQWSWSGLWARNTMSYAAKASLGRGLR